MLLRLALAGWVKPSVVPATDETIVLEGRFAAAKTSPTKGSALDEATMPCVPLRLPVIAVAVNGG